MIQMKVTKQISSLIVLLGISLASNAYYNRNAANTSSTSSTTGKTSAGCLPPATATDLDINNIRALIQTGGDMWYDLKQKAKYEAPKGSGNTSIFAGSLWLGGKDVSNQLKVAAQTYRQNGVDFYTGPLRIDNSETDQETCTKFDRHFVSYKKDVAQFVAANAAREYDAVNGTNTFEENFAGYVVPQIIQDWPGNNNDPSFDLNLAPFEDVDGDGYYNAQAGDYPKYDLKGNSECNTSDLDRIYGDQNIWWVFNDNGNIHNETGGKPIGMEIRAQAFAFASNDEVNNMTFYNYQLINRSTFSLTQTYFGFFVDTDLGGANDDFVGCDVGRGLGFCYNGDAYDDDYSGAKGYYDKPPAIGMDFFQGPFQDFNGIDDSVGIGKDQALNGVGYGDGIPDNERFGMRRFLYYNIGSGPTGDPDAGQANQYYNLLRGIWSRSNNPMIYGGTGIAGGCAAPFSCDTTDFMFPGSTDPLGWGTNGQPQLPWSEETAKAGGNTPGDRRFLHSAGPFTLAPGAKNYVTVGVVWAQASSGGPLASKALLIQADQKTQSAFDNCFKILEGPYAPELTFQEMDQELIGYINNPITSNNYRETYQQKDPSVPAPDSVVISTDALGNLVYYELTPAEKEQYSSYYFQGYKVYQVKDKFTSPADLSDVNKARLAVQCDIKDGVGRLVNYEFDEALQLSVPKLKVDGADKGIFHSFKITDDLFATSDKKLVNHKKVYFMAVAYAYNSSPYNIYKPDDSEFKNGQKKPYLEGGKSADGGQVKVFSAIPHKIDVENDGTILNSAYGDGVELTRFEGQGNGGHEVHITKESIDKIMAGEPWRADELVYEANYGPVGIKVIDPLNVPKGNFTLKFLEDDATKNPEYDGVTWELYFQGQINERDTTITYKSDVSIDVGNEQLLPQVGLSIQIEQVKDISNGITDPTLYGNAYLGASINFEDPSKPWLTGVQDAEGTKDGTNWIRSGKSLFEDDPSTTDFNEGWLADAKFTASDQWVDPNQIYEGILGGTWAPFQLCATEPHGPMPTDKSTVDLYSNTYMKFNDLKFLQSVDIVFTKDKSKWTRCPVLEMQADPTVSVGGAIKGYLRKSPSINKNGDAFDASGYANLIETPSSDNPDDANYIGGYGMGWFPGYAINKENGERLNIAFGEDSWLKAENGADMIWNPTDKITEGPFNNTRLGGKHYIIVFRDNVVNETSTVALVVNKKDQMPSYDYGKFVFEKLREAEQTAATVLTKQKNLRAVYSAGMWCSLPLVASGYSLLPLSEGLIPNTATISLHVSKPYAGYSTGKKYSIDQPFDQDGTYFVERGPTIYDGVTYNRGAYFYGTTGNAVTPATSGNIAFIDSVDNVTLTKNAARPFYTFNTDKYAVSKRDNATAVDALKLINVVPNPYYAYSEYEADRLDNRIKIINLPTNCVVTIYTTSGILVRKLSKSDPLITSLEWDLKNNANITVSSGLYIIHIDAPGIGERVIKWFGMMRPIDLDSF